MVSMRAVAGAAAVVVGMTGCGPAVVVQGFGAVQAPTCTVDDTGPSLSRGVLDLGATDRYQAFLRARTPRDADVGVVEAEVELTLQMTADEAAVFEVAAAQVNGASSLACANGECRTAVPFLTPAVTTELGLVGDERLLLVSIDAIPADVGATLAAVVQTARDLDPTVPLTDLEATLGVTLVDHAGGRSLPATFVIDLCRGCLAPTESICRELNATSQPLGVDSCVPGQDIATATCVCGDGFAATAAGCDF